MKRLLFVLSVLLFSAAAVMGQDRPAELQTEFMLRGFDALDNNELDSAKAFFSKEIEQHPDNGYAWTYLGVSYRLADKNYMDGVWSFLQAITLLPKKNTLFRAFAYNQFGWLYLENSQYDMALKMFKSADKLEKNDVKTLDNICATYLCMENYKDLKNVVKKMIKIEPLYKRSYFFLAYLELHQGNIDDAMRMCNIMLEDDPDNSQLHALKAAIAKEQGNIELEIDELLKEYSISYHSSTFNRIIEYLYNKEYEAYTLAKLRMYSMMYPELGNIVYVMANYYSSKEDYNTALSLYSDLYKSYPNDINLYSAIARCHLELGRYKELLDSSNEILQVNDSVAYLWYIRGSANYALGNISEAIEDVDHTINLEPERGEWYYQKGWYLEHTASPDTAAIMDNYNMSMQLAHDYAYTFMCAGRIFQSQGDSVKANKCFIHAIELEKDLEPKDITCLHMVYLYMGDCENAEKIMQLMLEADERSNTYDAACVYAQLGKADTALFYLGKYLETSRGRFTHIERDNDLDPIRDLPEFKALIEKYKE